MKKANIKLLLVSLVLIISLILGTSCELLPEVETAPSTPPATETTKPTEPSWTPPPVESKTSVWTDFVPVVAKVKPSVVAINIVIRNALGQTGEGAGSGWIIDKDGYVVTNNHVVEGADSITVTLDDGRTFVAEKVGNDWLTDLAVLKINADNLVQAARGDSDELEAGEWVLAIGNSLNLGVTPSEGIVRSLGVSMTVSPGQTLSDLVGTSAPINPGNSGGPLVNMQGEVVGITTVKIAMVEAEAMGWAISINSATPIITQLINKGYVVRPYLGIGSTEVTPYLVWRYDLAINEGVFVAEVVPGYPADKAGLKPEDVIVSFNGKEITNYDDFSLAINACEVGQKVEIIYWRGNAKKTTQATLTESPPPP